MIIESCTCTYVTIFEIQGFKVEWATPKCKLIKVKFLQIDLIGRDTRYMYIMYMHGCSINLINFKWRIF